jgi:hypothetical protein
MSCGQRSRLRDTVGRAIPALIRRRASERKLPVGGYAEGYPIQKPLRWDMPSTFRQLPQK